MILETVGLTKRYVSITAVDDVSWGVAEGETRAVIGPNGAGKTTMFNLLTGSLRPTNGQIVYDGIDITDKSEAARANLGIVKTSQITNIFGESTVFENIRIAAQANETVYTMHVHHSELEEVNKRAQEVLETVDLDAHQDETAAELSYGEQRKLEIGIALATEPTVLLLDEPTAGMEPEETDNMLDLFHEISNDLPMTTVITEHDIDLILNVADRITVLYQGQVLSEGRPDEIVADNDVQEVYLEG